MAWYADHISPAPEAGERPAPSAPPPPAVEHRPGDDALIEAIRAWVGQRDRPGPAGSRAIRRPAAGAGATRGRGEGGS